MLSTLPALVRAQEGREIEVSDHKTVTQFVTQVEQSQQEILKESLSKKTDPLQLLPLQVLKDLQDGNKRFVEGVTKSAGKDSVRRKAVLERENPSAVVLSCSDSRVPPELIFDRGLGDIYTIRVAGNVLGASSVASIEYAIARLGVRLIVILGHESCEIVKAALLSSVGKTSGSPDLDTLITSIHLEERSGRSIASLDNDSVIRKSVIFNVNGVAERLLKRSLIIRKSVEEGKVSIVRAIYGLESGVVDFWGITPPPTNK